MIHRLSELLTQYFMKYGQATDKAEVYIYGIECFISEFIGNLLLLIVAILWHQISAMIIWTLSFLLIRTQLGGFHCKTHFSCLCLSTSIGIFSLLINRFWLYHPSFCIPTYIACLFIIYHFALSGIQTILYLLIRSNMPEQSAYVIFFCSIRTQCNIIPLPFSLL